MPLILKVCCVIFLIGTLRCPLAAQQLSTRLTSLSLDCTQGNSLLKTKNKERVLHEKKGTSLSLGLSYNRLINVAAPGAQTLQRHYRIGFPLLAGFKLFKNCKFQAGGFLGVEMTRPQQAFWFARPEVLGQAGSEMIPSAGIMLGIGVDLPAMGQLNLRFLHDDNDFGDELGNIHLGWSLRW